MCGRFTLRAPASLVAETFALLELPELKARFNIAPSQPVAAVRRGAAAARELAWMRWGLVPGWAKDPSIGNRLINARAETAAEKPAFRAALRRRRCLVAADGFYEWQHAERKGDSPIFVPPPTNASRRCPAGAQKSGQSPARRKQPFLFSLRDGRPFAFAGLWESWQGPDAGPLESCTLLTTAANDLVRPIHDRMPVIVPPADYARWLDPDVEDPRQLAPLLRPYPSGEMAVCVVGPLVNSPANDDPRCVEPLGM